MQLLRWTALIVKLVSGCCHHGDFIPTSPFVMVHSWLSSLTHVGPCQGHFLCAGSRIKYHARLQSSQARLFLSLIDSEIILRFFFKLLDIHHAISSMMVSDSKCEPRNDLLSLNQIARDKRAMP
jgi:hypothetical protein